MNDVLFIAVMTLILGFTMTNGLMDGGGIVSTVIMTRTLEPFTALCLVACCEIAGVFLFGHAVVRTVGLTMVSFPGGADVTMKLGTLLSALTGALVWNTAMWRLSLPSSSSHALLGLIGATWQRFGLGALSLPVIVKVLIKSCCGAARRRAGGVSLSTTSYWVGSFMTPAWGRVFRALHVATLAGIALVHGSNDAQKAMAIILIAVVSVGMVASVATTPLVMLCGAGLAFGVIFGSRRTIQTVGKGFYRVQDLQDSARRAPRWRLLA